MAQGIKQILLTPENFCDDMPDIIGGLQRQQLGKHEQNVLDTAEQSVEQLLKVDSIRVLNSMEKSMVGDESTYAMFCGFLVSRLDILLEQEYAKKGLEKPFNLSRDSFEPSGKQKVLFSTMLKELNLLENKRF